MRQILPVLILLAACNKDAGDTGEVVIEPLAVAITSHSDGEFIDADSVSASGMAEGTGAEFLFNGNGFEPAEGAWQQSHSHSDAAWPDSPLWPLLAHGSTSDGWLRDRVTAIQGPSLPGADPIVDGLALRLTDHLLTSLRPTFEDLIVGFDIEGQLVTGSPVTTILGADVFVDRVAIAEITLDALDFTTSGLDWGATITGLELDIRIESFLGTNENTITADAVIVTGLMVFGGADDGSIAVTAQDTAVEFTNFAIDGQPDTLGLSGFLSDFLATEIEDAIADQIGDALSIQDELRDLDLGGVTIHSDFTSASHDDTGVNLYADSTVSTEAGPLTNARLSNPGARANPIDQEFEGSPYGLLLMLDDDLISGLGVGLFEGGLLVQTIEGEDAPINLTTTLLAGFVEAFEQLPADTPVSLVTAPTLGFPASPGTGAPEAARLHVGGMGLDFQVDTDGDGTPESQMIVVVDVIIALMGGDNLIDFDLVDIGATMTETSLVVSDPEVTEEALAGMFGVLLPGILSDALTGGLGSEDGSTLEGLESVGSAPVGPDADVAGLYFNIDPALLAGDEPAR